LAQKRHAGSQTLPADPRCSRKKSKAQIDRATTGRQRSDDAMITYRGLQTLIR
jgi:hypothetical protein